MLQFRNSPSKHSPSLLYSLLAGSSVLFQLSSAQAQADTEAGAESAQASKDESPSEEQTAPKEVEITDKARSHFRAGVNLLQDPDGARYEEAYRQFKAAYAESPSWKILSNLAIAAMKLERDGEAIDAFEKYLEVGGDQVAPEERAQFERDLQTLKASIATLVIKGNPSELRLTDRRQTNRSGEVINQYQMNDDGALTLRVRPGSHTMTARSPGYDAQTWEFEAAAASNTEHVFELQKPSEAPAGSTSPTDQGETYRPVTTGVWVGVGLTGALAASAVATGIVALNYNGEYDDANSEGDQDADDLRKQVKTMNLVTDMLIGGAVVAGAVTTILYVTRPTKRREVAAFRIDPIISPQGAALSLSGSF